MVNGIIKGIFIALSCIALFVYAVHEQRTQHKKIDKKVEKFDENWNQFDKSFEDEFKRNREFNDFEKEFKNF